MKSILVACALLAATLLCLPPAHPQQAGDPRLDLRLSASGNRYTFTITNLGSKALTAYSLDGIFPQNKRRPVHTWDSVLVDESPIEPNVHVSRGLGMSEDGPYPERVELVAGIWADGETFGKPLLVKQLLDARADRAADFERVAKLIQRGLDEKWSVDEYLRALDPQPPGSLAGYSLSSTLKGNSDMDDPKHLYRTVISMLDRYTGAYERIRRIKPVITAASNP